MQEYGSFNSSPILTTRIIKVCAELKNERRRQRVSVRSEFDWFVCAMFFCDELIVNGRFVREGYVRVLLAVVGFYLMTDWPYLTVSLYFISGLLDAFDGYAARVLKQGVGHYSNI